MKAAPIYIQALPGCGKTHSLQAFEQAGLYVVDGDDISRVYKKCAYPSRGERFRTVMVDAKVVPDIVLSSYWPHDFLPEMDVIAAFTFGMRWERYWDHVQNYRTDLVEIFGEKTLRDWCLSYEKLYDRQESGEILFRTPNVILLSDGEFVSDYVSRIVDLRTVS